MMLQALLWLGGAVALEVLWSISLASSHRLQGFWTTGVTLFAYALSLVCFERACRFLELSVAYAVCTGASVALVALAGILALHEQLTLAKAVGLSTVVVGIVLLVALDAPTDRAKEWGHPCRDRCGVRPAASGSG